MGWQLGVANCRLAVGQMSVLKIANCAMAVRDWVAVRDYGLWLVVGGGEMWDGCKGLRALG